MTSKHESGQAFVWIWLPGEIEPVVAGKLQEVDGALLFNYGKSYLERMSDASVRLSIYEPELPLIAGILPLLNGLLLPGCIRDASPDAWGRRVIINKLLGTKGAQTDTAALNELTYLLESGSDRIGALDFQRSAVDYKPRLANSASLEELLESTNRVDKGIPLTEALDQALFHGSSIGGARPKALVEAEGIKYVAKFSSSSDLYNIVKAEFIAMRLAKLVGLNVASVDLVEAANKDVILVERFDRHKVKGGWARKSMVSALTLLSLDEMMARYASYETLAEIIRHRFTDPKETLKELMSRILFSILSGNTDDHARNHAAFWDGDMLSLTPAYDICPQGRSGNIASQAMLISDNNRMSRVASCIDASHHFLLSGDEVKQIANDQKAIIETQWHSVCDKAALSQVDRNLLWHRQFLNPYTFE